MQTITAEQDSVRNLYHYQKFNPEHLAHLLESRSIFLSDTKGFNDPWDCRPCYDFTQLDDPAFHQRQVEYFDRIGRKRNLRLSNEEHEQRAARLRGDRAFLDFCIRQMGGIEAEIQKRYRVYCLTTKPANTLMWSHYADNHAGICLEFSTQNAVFSSAIRVQYCEKYPSLDLADDDIDSILLPIITKARAWSYENEYRVIAQEESEALNHESLITRKNFLDVPKEALSSIIVGCLAPQSTRDTIRDIVRKSGQGVRLQTMVRVPNHYELSVSDMA